MLLSGTRAYCSKIACVPPLRQALSEKVRAIEDIQRRDKDVASRDIFMVSFPEIVHHIEDEGLRYALIKLEKDTWPRGNKFRDQSRDMSHAEKTWVRMRVVELLERTEPFPISDEVAAFLEVYLAEKKVI